MTSNRLEPQNLTDFTGGLNYSTDQFSLADNESPDLMNIDLDPRSGFSTRRGWRRWNMANIVNVTTDGPWQPRNATVHTIATGEQITYVVEGSKVYASPEAAVFTQLVGPFADAVPHGADFVSWGQVTYMTGGSGRQSFRRNLDGTMTALAFDVWSEVDTPTGNTMPRAELCEGHAGYMFVACTGEGATTNNTRIRWSHPNRPDAWRADDFLDIEAYGGRVTAIISFRDHLLIFKTTSLWALYGYGDDSWQLALVSSSIGCPGITATTKSETTVFFFSASNKNAIYAYSGGEPTYISDKLRPALSQITAFDNVFVSWANRKLWVSVPWEPNFASAEPRVVFIFDPDIGQGAWTVYRSHFGAVASVVDGSDINSKFPLAAFWSEHTSAMLVLDLIDDAYDEILLESDPLPAPLGWEWGAPHDAGDLTRQPFEAYYRTRWLHAGWPDRKKSWRRPTFICRRVPRQVDLLVEHFRDYDETTTRRVGLVPGVAETGQVWSLTGSADPQGADWAESGVTWGAQSQGATIVRSDPMGHARALQMRVLPATYSPMRKWGVDGIIVKTTVQRFRT